MKGILGSIALADHAITTDKQFFCENGHFTIDRRTIHDHSPHGWLNLGGIIEVSSNIGASKIALTLGSQRYYEGLRAFGIGSRTGIDLPGEAGGLLSKPAGWKEIDLANHGFGQGVAVTPIQLAVAYAAIANGGNIVRPYVVKAAYDAEGQAIFTHTPQVLRRAIAPDIAHQMNLLLRNVVMSDGGTAAKARVDGFIVAGKTGTAQMVNPENGTYFQNRHVSSFVGFLPADDPRLLILVVLYDVGHEHFGGLIAAPVFSEIAQGAVRDLNITAPSEAGMIPMPDFGKDSSGKTAATTAADPRRLSAAADRLEADARDAEFLGPQSQARDGAGARLARQRRRARRRLRRRTGAGGRRAAQSCDSEIDSGCDCCGQRSRHRGRRECRARIVFQWRRCIARQAKVKLGELLEGLDVRRIDGDLNVEITGLSYDSRQTRPGHLYFSTARDATRNRANIDDALNRGARAVVVGWRGWWNSAPRGDPGGERAAAPADGRGRLAFLQSAERARRSDRHHRHQRQDHDQLHPASIFEAAGMPAGIIGTIGIFIGGKKIYSGLTTPESLDFESALAQMEREGVRHVAAEVSSIGIAEGRVDALNFRACMFTNLGRDHLDYHKTIEDYFAAKLRLFTEILPRSKRANTVAVVRGDDPYGRRVLDAVKGSKISFGMDSSLDVHPEKFDADLSGIRATLSVLGKKIEIESPLHRRNQLAQYSRRVRPVGGPGHRYGCGGGWGAAMPRGPRQARSGGGETGGHGAGRLRAQARRARGGADDASTIARGQNHLRVRMRRRSRSRQASDHGRDRGAAGRHPDADLRQSAQRRSAGDNRRSREGIDRRGPRSKHRSSKSGGYIVEPDRRAAIAIALTNRGGGRCGFDRGQRTRGLPVGGGARLRSTIGSWSARLPRNSAAGRVEIRRAPRCSTCCSTRCTNIIPASTRSGTRRCARCWPGWRRWRCRWLWDPS